MTRKAPLQKPEPSDQRCGVRPRPLLAALHPHRTPAQLAPHHDSATPLWCGGAACPLHGHPPHRLNVPPRPASATWSPARTAASPPAPPQPAGCTTHQQLAPHRHSRQLHPINLQSHSPALQARATQHGTTWGDNHHLIQWTARHSGVQPNTCACWSRLHSQTTEPLPRVRFRRFTRGSVVAWGSPPAAQHNATPCMATPAAP